jgi:hypothetical protein
MKPLNILLTGAVVALIVTQVLVIRGRDAGPARVVGSGRTPDRERLIGKLPDSLFNPDNPRLVVLRLLYNECKDCRDSVFEGAKRLAARIGKKNLCVVAGHYREGDFLMQKRLYSYDIRNFIAIPGKIAAPDTGENSYYFMVNKNFPGKVEGMFVPDPNNSGRTEEYFDRLAFYFN